jgi:hypothetical protein
MIILTLFIHCLLGLAERVDSSRNITFIQEMSGWVLLPSTSYA